MRRRPVSQRIVKELERNKAVDAQVRSLVNQAHAATPDTLEDVVMGNKEFDDCPGSFR